MNEINIFLLTFFLGIIAFSIPLFWNIYQDIFKNNKKITGDSVGEILKRRHYRKIKRYFTYYVQYPFGFFVFLGLFVIPLLFSLSVGIIILIAIFTYTLLLPQIVEQIYKKTREDIRTSLSTIDYKDKDAMKLFKELLRKEDQIKHIKIYKFNK
jgi:hypothetical protein